LLAFRTIDIPGPQGILILHGESVAVRIFSRFCFERNKSGGLGLFTRIKPAFNSQEGEK